MLVSRSVSTFVEDTFYLTFIFIGLLHACVPVRRRQTKESSDLSDFVIAHLGCEKVTLRVCDRDFVCIKFKIWPDYDSMLVGLPKAVFVSDTRQVSPTGRVITCVSVTHRFISRGQVL